MTPALVLSALISTAAGLIYHLVRGGGVQRILLFVIAAWIGFAVGQLIGSLLHSQLLVIGEVHVLEGLIGSLIALILAGGPEH